jgi:hypothetical protein
VDQGAELVQVLQHFLDEKTEKQLSGEIIERIRGLKTRQVDPKFHGTAYNNAHLYHWYKDLPFVDELPRKWWPNKPAHWPRFSSLPGRINPWAELTGRPAKDVVLDFCNLAEDDPDSRLPKRDGQPMPDYLAKLGRGEHHTFPSTEGNTGDFANCLVQQVALPAIFQVAAARGHAWNPEVPDDEQFSPLSQWCSGRLEKLIFKGMTVGKILSASDRWHEKVTFLQTRTNRVPRTSEKTWPALTNLSSAPNGVQFECLTSTAKLVEEGDRQHHCVGGYGYQCLYEDKHILSLVMPDGSYRSTLGIKFNPDTKKAAVFQHYGPHNQSELPEPLRVAADWLVNGINDGSIAVNLEAIKAANEEREKERLKDRFESLLMKVGFDPRDSDAADNAYRSLRIELMGVLPEPNRQDYFARRGILAFAHDEVDKYEQQNLKTFRVARLQAG